MTGTGFGGEVERDAEDVGVLDVESPVRVGIVRLAAERAADDLLAEKLRAEGADAQHVGDGPRVPALGEHRYRNDAADRAAQRVRLSDGIHHLPQQIVIRQVLGPLSITSPRDDLPAEALDLVARRRAEILVERLPGVELLAVDEQRVRTCERGAVLVEVAKQLQASVHER